MPPHTDWETPLAEIKGVAHALDFIGEGQDEGSLQESLWVLARVLRERAKLLETIIHSRAAAASRPPAAGQATH